MATKRGTSKAAAAQRRKLFIEAMVANGGNQTQAAIFAGAAPKSAHVIGNRLFKEAKIAAEIARRGREALEKAGLTSDEVMASLARDIRFDPAKLLNDDGTPKTLGDIDVDTRLALRGTDLRTLEVTAKGATVSKTTIASVRFPEKTAAREQAMKHFGLYRADNNQRPATLVVHPAGKRTIKFEPYDGRSRGKAK